MQPLDSTTFTEVPKNKLILMMQELQDNPDCGVYVTSEIEAKSQVASMRSKATQLKLSTKYRYLKVLDTSGKIGYFIYQVDHTQLPKKPKYTQHKEEFTTT